MFENFTDRARKIMDLANQQARRFNHEYIGTEHILLGLAKEGLGVGATVLKNLGVDLDGMELEVENLVKRGPDKVAKGRLPPTPRAKKALQHAIQEARDLKHNRVGSEHLLVGLMREGEGVAAQVLVNLGVELKKVRQGVLSLLGGEAESPDSSESAEATKCVNLLIREALKSHASAIHIEPTEDGRGRVRLRIDGVLHEIEPPPEGLFTQVVNSIKVMTAMDVEERSLPQDGHIMINLDDHRYDVRVSVVPCHFGQRLVIRVLDPSAIRVALNLGKVGFGDEDLAKMRELCHLPHGVVIVNGPTGCGKTTVLYAMLMEIDRETHSVFTVEDPVEYVLPGVTQTPIRPSIGLTFARAGRHILRQDPDVIMIGEIRDSENLNLVVQMALTGHLVFSTLHASTSPGAVQRMLDIGLPPFLVNSSLAAVISLRLVRVLCPDCKEPAAPPKHSMPPEAAEIIAAVESPQFYGPKGCDKCRGTGYSGRTIIHEILIMDDRIRQVVAASGGVPALRDRAIQSGMKTLMRTGLEKAARGITTVEEILRVVPHGPNI